MNLFAITGLLIGILVSVIAILMFVKGRRKLHYLWGAFCIAVVWWGFGGFMIALSQDANTALFWWRIAYIGVILIPILFTHFIYEFLNISKRWLIKIIYPLGLFFLVVNFIDGLFMDNVRWVFNQFYYISPPAPLYTPFVILFLGLVIYSHIKLWQSYRIARGITKTQFKYIFLATAIGFIGGSFSFLPVYKIDLYPFLNITIAFSPFIVGYAIFKYRLMDIRVVIKRSTIFSGLVVGVATAYVLVAFLLASLVYGGELTGIEALITTGLLVGVLTALGFRPLYGFLQRTTDRYLFKGEYQPEELIRRVSDELATALELKRIAKILTNEISRAMRLKGAELRILDGGLSLPKGRTPNLIKYLQKQKEVLVLEEMRRQYQEMKKYDQRYLAYKDLEKMGQALVVPIYTKGEEESRRKSGGEAEGEALTFVRTPEVGQLAALLFLKDKKSGDMFTDQDIRTLEIIASQAGIALENAAMYEKMKDFSKTLQAEVDHQTKELKEANIRLEQLDKAKSEFISIASHQLRTPLTAIKGLVSMALENFWGPLNENQRKYFGQVYQSGERLLKLIEDLLSISRIEAGKMEFIFQPVDLEKITQDVVQELLPQAKQKGLYLRLIKSKERLGRVKADSLKIRQVIQNLIDNALKYTIRGGASVRLKQEAGQIIFSVADTGLGIPADLKSVLFERFHRGKGAIIRHTEGTGLGLYLAAKLIEAHQGKIWVESEGEGKGSTFYFSLPVIK